jgi:tRNA nucleotidyltransferase (CCA-adding enzyme)
MFVLFGPLHLSRATYRMRPMSTAATATPTLTFWEVGGCVRDELLGLHTKDVDFAVVAEGLAPGQDPFRFMVDHLVAEGFKVHQERPEFVTVRAGVPQGHPLRERTKDADFVLARRDGMSTDGRRPDFVEVGTLEDDLARRDFTVNALARAEDGTLVDPHGGQADLEARLLRFVGVPEDRVREDGLRVLRGLRFMVCKGLTPTVETWDVLNSQLAADMLGCVATERVRDELERMLAHDTLATLALLAELEDRVRVALFPEGLRLSATMKG